MNKTRGIRLVKGTVIYAIGSFGTKILSFLITPLYTYYIATSDMGIYDIVMTTIGLIAPLITMQISDAAYKFLISDHVKEKEQYIRATSQVLFVNCAIAVIIICTINFFYPIKYALYFSVLLTLTRVFDTFQKLLRGLKKQWLYALSGIVYTAFFLFFNVYFLSVKKMGMESLFISGIIAYTVAILMVFIFEKQFHFSLFQKPDMSLIKTMYKFSIPLVPNYLNWWIINSSDRYIVLSFLGSGANGVLAIAHKFPAMLQSVLSLFNNSWQDLAISDDDGENDKFYTKIFGVFSRFSLTCLFLLIPITKIVILLIMGQEYKESCDYVSFYYLGAVFQCFASLFGVGYLKSGKTTKAFVSSVVGSIVNACANIALIQFIGLQAAAISTFLAFLIMWIIRVVQTKNDFGIRVNWATILLLTLLCVGVCVFSIRMDLKQNIILCIVGAIMFLIFNIRDILFFCKNLVKRKWKFKKEN